MICLAYSWCSLWVGLFLCEASGCRFVFTVQVGKFSCGCRNNSGIWVRLTSWPADLSPTRWLTGEGLLPLALITFVFIIFLPSLSSRVCFHLLLSSAFITLLHILSRLPQWRRPPYVCSETLSTPQGSEVNCHEQTTTPQRVSKPVISYCEFTRVHLGLIPTR